MHERSHKASPLDTVLYEIDMLRHCATTLSEKLTRAEKTGSSADRSEYYLGIEGFLLHLRNLIAFLTSQQNGPTDLGINDPQLWANRPIEKREYSDLMKRVRDINGKYGTGDSSCYDQISKFLQHCTTYRHEDPRDWDIEGICKDIEPVLKDFESRFAAKVAKTDPQMTIAGINHSTTTMRTSAIPPDQFNE